MSRTQPKYQLQVVDFEKYKHQIQILVKVKTQIPKEKLSNSDFRRDPKKQLQLQLLAYKIVQLQLAIIS